MPGMLADILGSDPYGDATSTLYARNLVPPIRMPERRPALDLSGGAAMLGMDPASAAAMVPPLPPSAPPAGMLGPDMGPAATPAPPVAPASDPSVNYPIAPPMGLLNGYPSAPAAAPTPTGAPLDLSPPSPQQAPSPAAVKAAAPNGSLLDRIGQMINDHPSTLLALGAGLSGAQNLGQGLSRGFAGAVPAMQQDIQLQRQNQTVEALKRRGVPTDIALAAASNPMIMSQLVANVFGAKQRQFTQVGEDMMGNKRFGFVDPVANKVFGLDGKEITSQGGAGTLPIDASGTPLAGDDLLKYLERNDPVTASGVKGLIAGNLSAQGRNLQKLGPIAERVDPSFSMATFPARVALQKSYMGGGKDFQEVQALNTVSGHMGRLMDSADALDNSNFKPINYVKNWYSDAISDNPKLVRFRNDLVTTQNELAKAYHGGHVSDSAYAAFNKSVNEAQTPAAMKAAIGEIADLLGSKIEAKESGYRTAMGKAPLPDEYRAINDEAKSSFQRIHSWANGTPPGAPQSPKAAAPAIATPPDWGTAQQQGWSVKVQ